MSTQKLTKATLPSFDQIDRLVHNGHKERAIAFQSAFGAMAMEFETEMKPGLATAAR